MINNFEYYLGRLEPALEFYLAERARNENEQAPFMAYGMALVALIHSQIEGSLAIRLQGVVTRYASHQAAN